MRGRRSVPLIQEVPISVDDIWLRQFVFDERDDVGEVALAGVLAVCDSGHGGREGERDRYRTGMIYILLPLHQV